MGMATATVANRVARSQTRLIVRKLFLSRRRVKRTRQHVSRVLEGARFLSFLCIGVTVPAVEAAEWRILPRVGLKGTYTDNLRLAPKGSEESDFVTEISPGVSISGQGSRLQVSADYVLTYRAYAENASANGHQNSLRSNALLDVWDRKLFLQGSASIAQQNLSPLGVASASNINLTPNRTEVRQASLSPYWVSRLGTFASLQARYSWIQYESSGVTQVLDTETQGVQITVASGPEFSDLGWSLSFSQQQIDSSSGQFTRRDLESTTANVRYRVWPTLFVLGTLGRDHNTYGSARGSTGGDFYSLGLEWAPSVRTHVRGELGERYFGNTASFNAEHRTRLTSWQLTYSEQIIATPGQFILPVSLDTTATVDRLFQAQFPDPIERQQIVQAYILQNGLPSSLATSIDFLTNQVSLSKRLQGIFGLRGTRGSFLLSIFRDNRSSETVSASVLPTDPFALSRTVIQTGYSGILSWRFSELTTGSASLGQIKSKLTDVSREDTNNTLRIGVSRQLASKLSGSIEYRRLERDSTTGGLDVRENAITGTLSMTF